MRPQDILMPVPAGLCCKEGSFHIDPVRPVERAVITHGHSDHARPGHGTVLATRETLDMMRLRYGDNFARSTQAVPYQRIREHVKSLQPDIVMIDHGGLSVPYLGDAIYFEEPLGVTSPAGNTYASLQGQTISNGWFWHPTTPTTDPMSRDAILSHLTDLEPKYTSFILNCPPNRNGKLDTNIVNRLAEVGAAWSPNTSRPPSWLRSWASGVSAGTCSSASAPTAWTPPRGSRCGIT